VIYVISAVLLAVYGLNSLVLIGLYWRHHRSTPPVPPPPAEWPAVTIQLPIYNELHVVDRLLEAVTRLRYPRSQLQIQVLDDSTDETTALIQEKVIQYQAQGWDITVLHRNERTGFKAGALAAGLSHARGEFIVIFDADFVPEPDFLERTVPYCLARPRLGFLQTRWGHINADYSRLTQAQAVALDGHFIIEQTARQRSGLYMGFNGTAGIWRRQAIESAGGWQADTLCEDLDLSYRAQLQGWEALYLPDVVTPAEVPPQLIAFKRQQARWARGSIQCLLKLGHRLLKAPTSAFTRFEGLLHLSGYMIHPLMLSLLLSSLPMILWSPVHLPLAYLTPASLGPPFLYILAQRELSPNWFRRLEAVGTLILLGTGLALSNSLAIIGAFLRLPFSFRRTPKFRIKHQQDPWITSRYALPLDWESAAEIGVALYALATIIVAMLRGNLYAVPFLTLYLASFVYVAGLGFWQARTKQRIRRTFSRPFTPTPASRRFEMPAR